MSSSSQDRRKDLPLSCLTEYQEEVERHSYGQSTAKFTQNLKSECMITLVGNLQS